jgi:glucose dehydrogenase
MNTRKSTSQTPVTRPDTATFGLLMAVLGLALLMGSIWNSASGLLLYFTWLGLMLLICGGLFYKGKKLGITLFVLTFVVMVIWNVYELGLHWESLIPRLGMGLIILIYVLTAKQFKNLA